MLYIFGAYEFDTERHALRLAGTPVRLEPKVFDLLAYLLQRHDQFVSREELHTHLWPNQFVSESALHYCIAEARKAVGDSGRAQRTIKTVHGRGYCFIAPVQERLQRERPAAVAMPSATLPGVEVQPLDLQDVLPSPLQSTDLPDEAVAVRWPDPVAAERRQLTVLWCRSVVSSTHTTPLDPEDLHHILQEVVRVCDAIIGRFEGRMAQHLGAGFVVYFGHPRAHEDDAQRAVHTGLHMLQGVEELARRLHSQRGIVLTLHIGIHTGPAVVGTVGSDDMQSQLARGNTPDLAAQLASRAAPNTVLLSPATFRLIEGAFVCQALGVHVLTDATEPLVVYQALQARDPHAPPGATRAPGVTPFMGRAHEVGLLRERWEQSTEGRGQIVLLSGEAGIGKSRLVQVFQESLGGETYTRLECRCSPYYQHSALYLVVEYMPRWLQWRQDDTPEVKLRKLEKALTAYDFDVAEAVPLCAALLSLPSAPRYPAGDLTPEQQRQRTFEALLAWLRKKAEKQALCLIIEDLHWVDPSTLELLTLLIDQVPTARILVLLTCRPDFSPPWGVRSHVTSLALSRLTQVQTAQMIAQVATGTALPAAILQQLVVKTNGVPLFIEEMTKMVLESGLVEEPNGPYASTAPLPPLAIPSTLHASLMARLDRQGIGKRVAQLSATLGREFSYEVIQAVSPLDETVLRQGLAQLVHAEILYQRGLPPQAQYLFKHALIQEAAYQSLLRHTRQQYHRQIARVLEERFPETRLTQPELLAHHYAEAGLSAVAVAYWQQAGQRAMAHSAHVEALAHLRRGLALTASLPETPERPQHELRLYLALGVALMATQGYAAPEVEQAYLEAWARCQQVGDEAQLFTVLRGLWLVHLIRSQIAPAAEQGEQLLVLARRHADPMLLLEAHRVLGTSRFFLGDLATAWDHLTQALGLYEAQQHGPLTVRYGQDPGMACLVYTAWVLWLRGYPDQALDRIHQALALAQQCAHSFCLAFARTFAVFLHWFRRETQAVGTQVEVSLTLARQHGFPLLVALGTVFQGGVLSTQAPGEASVEQIRQGIVAYRATGAELFRPYFLGLLAQAYSNRGRPDAGLEAVAEALTLMETSGERLHEAELYRQKGELLLQSTGHSPPLFVEVEACFQHALAVARQQQARSFELRAAMSLSRLWQRQGKHDQARRLLGACYDWFREGFDTGDLREARALLDLLQ